MKSYGEQKLDKQRMDTLQIGYSCCGGDGYRDWFTVPWQKHTAEYVAN